MKKFTWIDWVLLAIILFGLGYGVYDWIGRSVQSANRRVSKSARSVMSAETIDQKEIFVDVGGEVEKAGVYRLENGSRMKDALAVAGCLSAKADREFVARNLNLAERLVDGQKVYIPEGRDQRTEGRDNKVKGAQTSKININKASLSELETLSGIGVVRAQAIIDGRPYRVVDDLATKKIVPISVYEKIKDKISVY